MSPTNKSKNINEELEFKEVFGFEFFYESDVAYTGAPSHNGKRGLGTDKQSFLVVLSTEQENQYPLYIKLHEVSSDSGNLILRIL